MTPVYVAMTALGCAKNQINAEQMMYTLRKAGYELTGDTARAGVNVVNTCAFLETARQEAVDQILELAALPGRIVVTGCLAQLVGDEIFTELPEVSAIVGCGSFDRIAEAVRAACDGERFAAMDALGGPVPETPRVVTGVEGECAADGGITAKSTYLKLSEGCSNHCAYCLIPAIRGPHVSRPLENIVNEARELTENGVKELILVAQDLTRYGEDLDDGSNLCELLRRLCELERLRWLRLHYLHPGGVTDELIALMARQEKIVKYADVPIQHCSDGILSAMNRRYTKERLISLIGKLREQIPGVVLRTTVITGFPGETESQHREMCEFLREHKIPRAGIFQYSGEPDTPAAEMPDQVPEDVKQRRYEQLMEIQRDVLDDYNQAMEGQIAEVLCEGYDRLAEMYFGRSRGESPDVDGKVFWMSDKRIEPGEIVRIRITGAENGDLVGQLRAGAYE
jgi:ribosomal protein S12 methylthiotransferase